MATAHAVAQLAPAFDLYTPSADLRLIRPLSAATFPTPTAGEGKGTSAQSR